MPHKIWKQPSKNTVWPSILSVRGLAIWTFLEVPPRGHHVGEGLGNVKRKLISSPDRDPFRPWIILSKWHLGLSCRIMTKQSSFIYPDYNLITTVTALEPPSCEWLLFISLKKKESKYLAQEAMHLQVINVDNGLGFLLALQDQMSGAVNRNDIAARLRDGPPAPKFKDSRSRRWEQIRKSSWNRSYPSSHQACAPTEPPRWSPAGSNSPCLPTSSTQSWMVLLFWSCLCL